VHRALELRPETVLKLLGECDALRRPERFSEMLLACQCDSQGRTGLEQKPYPQREYLERARALAAAVVLNEDERAGLEGPAIARALQARRLTALEEHKCAVAAGR
jgi:tRNA nucleotidyltransferase (CCA-adding enzyme)